MKIVRLGVKEEENYKDTTCSVGVLALPLRDEGGLTYNKHDIPVWAAISSQPAKPEAMQ